MFLRPSPRAFYLLMALAMITGFAAAQIATPQIAAPETTISALNVNDSQPADFVFQKRVDEVNLLFTVVDKKGRFISNLELTDFELLDDQRPPEKIHSFQRESNLPLNVALLVDMSGSVTQRFKYEQQSAIEFLKKILRPDLDKAMVVGFNQTVNLEQDFTNEVASLQRAIDQLRPSGTTALYDAVVFAADKLRHQGQKGTRKIIILISDGENNSSHAIMNDAQLAALRAEAPIYALSTNRLDNEYPKGEAILELLSRYTGGEILPAREKSEVARAFRQVEEALRSEYVLSYKPADLQLDGRYRVVNLNAKRPALKVECRRGYYAPRH
ncbi:MAG: VWA domain-containing protein [Terriglobales bacterium]